MKTFNSEIELISKEEFQTLFHPIKKDRIALVVDKVIASKFSEIIETLKNQRENIEYIEINAGPELKSTDSYFNLSKDLIKRGLTRKSHLIAIGGGALSDLVGFVASTIYRGISWSVVPTTILAMVDAAIGGKTGIDTDLGKNLIGSFHHPDHIYLYSEFIETLPESEQLSGKGEIVKYALLSRPIFDRIMDGSDFGLIMDHCASYKAEVVKKDPEEAGLRKILNLGHTFGHGYEKITKQPHGICVLWGLRFMDQFFWNNSHRENIDKLVEQLQIKESPQDVDMLQLLDFVKNDKKRISKEELEIINIKEVGQPYIDVVTFSKLREVISCQ